MVQSSLSRIFFGVFFFGFFFKPAGIKRTQEAAAAHNNGLQMG